MWLCPHYINLFKLSRSAPKNVVWVERRINLTVNHAYIYTLTKSNQDTPPSSATYFAGVFSNYTSTLNAWSRQDRWIQYVVVYLLVATYSLLWYHYSVTCKLCEQIVCRQWHNNPCYLQSLDSLQTESQTGYIARGEDCLEDGSLKKLPSPATIKSAYEMHVASV